MGVTNMLLNCWSLCANKLTKCLVNDTTMHFCCRKIVFGDYYFKIILLVFGAISITNCSTQVCNCIRVFFGELEVKLLGFRWPPYIEKLEISPFSAASQPPLEVQLSQKISPENHRHYLHLQVDHLETRRHRICLNTQQENKIICKYNSPAYPLDLCPLAG